MDTHVHTILPPRALKRDTPEHPQQGRRRWVCPFCHAFPSHPSLCTAWGFSTHCCRLEPCKLAGQGPYSLVLGVSPSLDSLHSWANCSPINVPDSEAHFEALYQWPVLKMPVVARAAGFINLPQMHFSINFRKRYGITDFFGNT